MKYSQDDLRLVTKMMKLIRPRFVLNYACTQTGMVYVVITPSYGTTSKVTRSIDELINKMLLKGLCEMTTNLEWQRSGKDLNKLPPDEWQKLYLDYIVNIFSHPDSNPVEIIYNFLYLPIELQMAEDSSTKPRITSAVL